MEADGPSGGEQGAGPVGTWERTTGLPCAFLLQELSYGDAALRVPPAVRVQPRGGSAGVPSLICPGSKAMRGGGVMCVAGRGYGRGWALHCSLFWDYSLPVAEAGWRDGGAVLGELSALASWPPCLSAKELVVQKGWRLPEYTVTQESGPAHRKEFTMTCRVERFIEIGNGVPTAPQPYSVVPWLSF